MACKLPHTVEELQTYIKKQTEKGDTVRQNAIIEVIKQFDVAKKVKNQLREQYTACQDISAERKAVIDQFLYDEYCKDSAIAESLWGCVSQIQAQISNKIRWSYVDNVAACDAGASTSSVAPRVVEQQPHLEHFKLSFEENVVAADDGGWNEEKDRELSRLEAQLEADKFASFATYDDGYLYNNSQTWDHPDYN